jgi:hypothetical protein
MHGCVVDIGDAGLAMECNATSDDEELVLTAFNPEDYEYTMFLQFVDPSVEKEYLHNAKMKVAKLLVPCLQSINESGRLCIQAHASLLSSTRPAIL